MANQAENSRPSRGVGVRFAPTKQVAYVAPTRQNSGEHIVASIGDDLLQSNEETTSYKSMLEQAYETSANIINDVAAPSFATSKALDLSSSSTDDDDVTASIRTSKVRQSRNSVRRPTTATSTIMMARDCFAMGDASLTQEEEEAKQDSTSESTDATTTTATTTPSRPSRREYRSQLDADEANSSSSAHQRRRQRERRPAGGRGGEGTASGRPSRSSAAGPRRCNAVCGGPLVQ